MYRALRETVRSLAGGVAGSTQETSATTGPGRRRVCSLNGAMSRGAEAAVGVDGAALVVAVYHRERAGKDGERDAQQANQQPPTRNSRYALPKAHSESIGPFAGLSVDRDALSVNRTKC